MFSKTKTFLLDTLFPISCVSCGKPDEWICDPCFSKIKLQENQYCLVCRKRITPFGQPCFACRGESPLNNLFVCASYKDPILSQAIHLFKYNFIESLGENLARPMSLAFENSDIPLPDIVIPVPLHLRRLRWRGFNQAELLARNLKTLQDVGIEIKSDLLIRKKYTTVQMELKKKADRQKNIQGAFAIEEKNKSIIYDKSVLLIDDVVTTGYTLEECAKVLKSAGAKKVFAIVLARG